MKYICLEMDGVLLLLSKLVLVITFASYGIKRITHHLSDNHEGFDMTNLEKDVDSIL